MFTRKYWHVLIVDDEPDMHEVTRLTLRKEQFYGVRLKLHHAHSAAEATELLRGDPALTRSLAVALVDVVMETDHAGLDFCRFVRDELRRQSIQLILRTGQPGQAPPRKIIDELSLSNYMTKLEATSDRVYMTVKSSIQQYYETSVIENWAMALEALRASDHPFHIRNTREALLASFQDFLSQNWGADQEFHVAYDFFGAAYAGAGYFKDRAVYDGLKEDLLARAAPQLEGTTTRSYFGGTPDAATPVPNRVAKVDNFVICQTSAIGTDKLATMVLKDPSYPREDLGFNSVIWRVPLAWLAQAMVPAR